jgi:hypothetical protein
MPALSPCGHVPSSEREKNERSGRDVKSLLACAKVQVVLGRTAAGRDDERSFHLLASGSRNLQEA